MNISNSSSLYSVCYEFPIKVDFLVGLGES
jgi:hypothetical protein